MPITDEFKRLALDSIWVERDERQRRAIETADLEPSIAKIGVLKPIIVERPGTNGLARLVAGERRLEASRKLGLPDIIVRYADELSLVEFNIIELEENLKRSDLDWKDMVGAVARIHGLYCQLDSGWTMGETADAISLSAGTVSIYLRVAGELADPRLADAGTVREAYNVLARRDQRAAGDALNELLEIPEQTPALPVLATEGPPALAVVNGAVVARPTVVPQAVSLPEGIQQADFISWVTAYTGSKFNLVHCDFPYGVNLFAGPQGRGSEPASADGSIGYDDSDATYWKLIEAFCGNLDKFMSVSAHLFFWCSADHGRVAKTVEAFARQAPSLAFAKFPLIWVKSDNAGIAATPNHGARHVYETCLFASRGKRQIVKVVGDAYSAPTDKRFHASTKPEPMLRHFMSMVVDHTTTLLDPTAGSGAALRAADSLGARQALGLEINPEFATLAQQAFRSSRAMRVASSGSGK